MTYCKGFGFMWLLCSFARSFTVAKSFCRRGAPKVPAFWRWSVSNRSSHLQRSPWLLSRPMSVWQRRGDTVWIKLRHKDALGNWELGDAVHDFITTCTMPMIWYSRIFTARVFSCHCSNLNRSICQAVAHAYHLAVRSISAEEAVVVEHCQMSNIQVIPSPSTETNITCRANLGGKYLYILHGLGQAEICMNFIVGNISIKCFVGCGQILYHVQRESFE